MGNKIPADGKGKGRPRHKRLPGPGLPGGRVFRNMARRCLSGGFPQTGDIGSGGAGQAGVTLLEIIIALAVTLIISLGLSAAGARSEQRALYNACLQLQADIREAQHRAVLEGVNYTISFLPADGCYKMYKTPLKVDKAVYFEKGVSYDASKGLNSVTFQNNKTLTFSPRGTPSGGGAVYLKAGGYSQKVTVVLSSGRASIDLMIE